MHKVLIELYDDGDCLLEDITTSFEEYYVDVWQARVVNYLKRDKVKIVRFYLDDVFQFGMFNGKGYYGKE